MIAIFKVLLPQNETLATPLANAVNLYEFKLTQKFMCLLDIKT